MRLPCLIDTTIREGQQHGEVSFTSERAVWLAGLLDAFGVDLIEVGHPVVSDQDRQTAKAICRAGLNAQTLAHARVTHDDVVAAAEAGAQWVGMFAGVNDVALRYKLHRDRAAVLLAIREAVAEAKALGLRVRFTCEDASRTPLPDVIEAFEQARTAGADRLSYADTVGVMRPDKMRATMRRLRKYFGDMLHVHCHNDCGLATANTLAAIEAGAAGVDVSIDGIGERCGIAPLAEVALGLTQLYHVKAPWKLSMLTKLSAALRDGVVDYALDTRPIVGRYTCAHKAGLHIAAALHAPEAYECYPPELVGQRRQFLASRLAGKKVVAPLHQRSVDSPQARPQPVKVRFRRNATMADSNGYSHALAHFPAAEQDGRD